MAKIRFDLKGMQNAFLAVANTVADQHVLDLGWDGLPFCQPLRAKCASVHFLGDDVRAVLAAQDAGMSATQAPSPHGFLRSVDAVFYHPEGHAAKGLVFNWIEAAFAKLNVGGFLYFAGQKDKGVLSYIKHIEAVFGQVKRVGRSGRMQFFEATKGEAHLGFAPTVIEHRLDPADLPCGPVHFYTQDGVFSRDGIDVGSRLLLDNVTVSCDAQILDVGCGYGLLGLVCAKLAPQGHVQMVDVSAQAILCAQKNIQSNDLTHATAVVGDLYAGVENRAFDLIFSNPPFHAGNKVAWPLIEGAYERLANGGKLQLVVMRPVPYLKHIERVFGEGQILSQKDGYTVLQAQKKS